MENYNVNYVCNYNTLIDQVETIKKDALQIIKKGVLTIDEKEKVNQMEISCESLLELSDVSYRIDLFNIFYIDKEEEDDKFDIIKEIQEIIYNRIISYLPFKNCLLYANKSTDLEEGYLYMSFIMFFSYDYLYITHRCISEYLRLNFISKSLLNELNEQIKKKIYK